MTPSPRDLVLYSLRIAGGAARSVHVEDIAVECWRLAPESFAWSTRADYPDKEIVRRLLSESADLTTPTGADCWTLTPAGAAWVKQNLPALDEYAAARAVQRQEIKQRQIFRGAIAIGTLAAVGVAIAMARLGFAVGSAEGHWLYDYIQDFDPRWLLAALVATAAAGLLVAGSDAIGRRHEWLLVLTWGAGALAIQALLRSLTPVTFENIFVSDGSNSFYSVARSYSLDSVLRDFERLRVYWPLHAHSNMPGKLIAVFALKLISRRPDVLAWLVVGLSNVAGGAFMYLFVRDLFGDRQVALFSLVLYLFVPAKLYFFPLLNTVTPVVALLCAWLCLRWLQTRRTVYPVLLGVALYALVLFEPLALGVGLLLALLAIRALWLRDVTWRMFLGQCAVVVVGFAAAYAAMFAWYRFDLFHALNVVGAGAIGFNARHDRPYGLWVRQNAIDFLFGVGICQAIVFFVVLADSVKRSGWPANLTRPIATVSVALFGILAITDLLGFNRGEVIRLWVFLACLFQIPTAYACARLGSRTALMAVLATTLLQDTLGTAMIGFVMAG